MSSYGGRAGDNLGEFLGDDGLSALVVNQRQLVDQGRRIVGSDFIATMRADCSEAMFSNALIDHCLDITRRAWSNDLCLRF
jgi:hypothetical protein